MFVFAPPGGAVQYIHIIASQFQSYNTILVAFVVARFRSQFRLWCSLRFDWCRPEQSCCEVRLTTSFVAVHKVKVVGVFVETKQKYEEFNYCEARPVSENLSLPLHIPPVIFLISGL